MYALLLAIIYMAFISLGLPDSLLGSVWPTMQSQMDVPLSYAGIISMTIAGGTIVSSLLSNRITKRFGAGLVTALSVLMTAVALLGFSVSDSFWMLCIWAIPYGLGAGAIDAALNHYVALHYASRHMNWLHCCWGVGAAVSPFIMNFALTHSMGWQGGYRTVFFIQIVLTAILLISQPLWKQHGQPQTESTAAQTPANPHVLRIKGVLSILFAFFCYCGLEMTAGLWASSFLVNARNIDVETAAGCASLFFLGITFGRFACGFVSNKLGDRNMIKIGIGVMLAGIAAILIPAKASGLAGLILFGLGCAPIYPAIIHSTPENFGTENAQAIIGIQMASAYTGSTFMPPLFGLVANHIGIGWFPLYLLALTLLMWYMTHRLNRAVPHTNALT